jgi:hypothetical protein
MKSVFHTVELTGDNSEYHPLQVGRGPVVNLYGRIALALLVIASVFLIGSPVWAACDPGPGQAAFFMDANFGGLCVVKDIGEYPNSGDIGLPNDSISSVRVGSNAQAVVCKDAGFQGDCVLLRTGVVFLNGDRVGNDQVSSAKVQASGTLECVPGSNQVAFFEHADFLAPCVVKDPGVYDSSTAIGLPNDSISSIRVGSDARVEVCKDVNLKGACMWLDTSVSFLGSGVVGNVVGNDQISSVQVLLRGKE